MKLDFNKHWKLRSGNYVINAYIQDSDINEFWKLWNIKKNEIKEKGFSVKKYKEKWQLSYWTGDNNIERFNYKCRELCKELGFIENNKLLNLPNEIIYQILLYLDYRELNIIKDTHLFSRSNYKDFHKIIIDKIFNIVNVYQNIIKKTCFNNIKEFNRNMEEIRYCYDEKKDYVMFNIKNNEFIEYLYFYRYRHQILYIEYNKLYKNRKRCEYITSESQYGYVYKMWCSLCYLIKLLSDTNYKLIPTCFDSDGYNIDYII